ncbi:MAG: purine-binding chemotaxis protein CheW [candidate division NC10 bacterium]|nr:purine-binding chemotaxis protein CheW [candidate division NC10 bacterium]
MPEGLALEPISQETPTQEGLVCFRMGDEWFALRIEEVREIAPIGKVTRVPNAPPGVVGVMNLRGKVLTLYDLGVTLDIPMSLDKKASQILVLDLGDPELEVGILVEEVSQIREVSRDLLEENPLPEGFRAWSSYLRAIASLDGLVFNILDLRKAVLSLIPDQGKGPE